MSSTNKDSANQLICVVLCVNMLFYLALGIFVYVKYRVNYKESAAKDKCKEQMIQMRNQNRTHTRKQTEGQIQEQHLLCEVIAHNVSYQNYEI